MHLFFYRADNWCQQKKNTWSLITFKKKILFFFGMFFFRVLILKKRRPGFLLGSTTRFDKQ